MTATTSLPEGEIQRRLLEQQRLIQAFLDGSLVVRASDARILDVNEACCRMAGYSREELLSMHIFDLEANKPPTEISAHIKKVMEVGHDRFESCFRHKHGHLVDLEIRVSHSELDSGVIYVFIRDITERKQAEKYEQFRGQTLELLSGGAPLQLVLESIVRGVERLSPQMICSILLLDSAGKRLCKGVAPSLPDAYNAALDGIEIGIGVGCCGTAAFTGERVIVDDIQTHPYWTPYKELAACAGVGACWSQPIRSSSGQVLGTFAVYHREAHSHTESDLSIIEKPAHLASIAIERKAMEQAIAAREQEFRNLAETSPDQIVRYDREGRHLYLNAKFLKLLRLANAEEVIGKRPSEVWTDGRFAELEQAAARAVESESQVDIELVDLSETGSTQYHQIFIVPERGVNGQIVGTIAFGRDITGIRETEWRLKRFIENLPGMVYTLRQWPDGRVGLPYTSPAIEEFYGLKPEDVKDDMVPIHSLAHPEDRPRIDAAMAESGRTMTPFRLESRVCRPGVPERWLDVRSAPDKQTDGSVLWHGIMLDITERKQAEQQLRKLTAHIQTIREEEKAHLAREIHDDLGGILVALKVEAHLLSSGLSAEQKRMPLFAGVASMVELLDEALNTTRHIITDLRPTVLDDHGLLAAFEWQAVQFHKLTGIECRIACTVKENDTCTGCKYYEHSLNKPLSITLFRILQESLNNVARHSGASTVEVELRPCGQEMRLTISDNGRGLPERFTIASSSYGIRGMRERVEQLGGKIELAQSPGGGLSVIARFPLPTASQ